MWISVTKDRPSECVFILDCGKMFPLKPNEFVTLLKPTEKKLSCKFQNSYSCRKTVLWLEASLLLLTILNRSNKSSQDHCDCNCHNYDKDRTMCCQTVRDHYKPNCVSFTGFKLFHILNVENSACSEINSPHVSIERMKGILESLRKYVCRLLIICMLLLFNTMLT